jgi:hypothetical protein
MKTLLLSAVLAIGAYTAGPALATCNDATLHGTVAAAINKTSSGAPTATAYIESWDGAGHLQYQESDSQGYSHQTYFGTGTYQISKECIATVYYDGATTNPYLYYVAPNGQGYWWANNQNVGVVAAGHAELISKDLIVDPTATTAGPCSVSSLHGTMAWSAARSVQGTPHASGGFESYDGAGHLRYQQTDSDGYTTTTSTGTGTYTISDRCVASVYYDGASVPMLFWVAPDGASYWWINLLDSGVVAAGQAQRVSHELVLK